MVRLGSLHLPTTSRLRQYSVVDGAVVIGMDGTAHSAGTYFKAAWQDMDTNAEWGGRHRAAAAITTVANAASIVICETTGVVTVIWDGRPVLVVPSK